jgi:hypothetical protein
MHRQRRKVAAAQHRIKYFLYVFWIGCPYATVLRALRYFVAAADAGSVTAAAGEVRVSQPSISAAIAQLEADLGVQLFVRHHARGLSMTAAGERFLAHARGLLAHAREVEQFAGSMGDAQSGEVSAACFITLRPSCCRGCSPSSRPATPASTCRSRRPIRPKC